MRDLNTFVGLRVGLEDSRTKAERPRDVIATPGSISVRWAISVALCGVCRTMSAILRFFALQSARLQLFLSHFLQFLLPKSIEKRKVDIQIGLWLLLLR